LIPLLELFIISLQVDIGFVSAIERSAWSMFYTPSDNLFYGFVIEATLLPKLYDIGMGACPEFFCSFFLLKHPVTVPPVDLHTDQCHLFTRRRPQVKFSFLFFYCDLSIVLFLFVIIPIPALFVL
jgi:hypothetical protein